MVGKKVLSEEQYSNFESRYRQAKLSVSDRETQVFRLQFNLLDFLGLFYVLRVQSHTLRVRGP